MPIEVITKTNTPSSEEYLGKIQERLEEYANAQGLNGFYRRPLIAHAKSILFSRYDGAAMSKVSESGQKKLAIDTFVFIVSEVCRLSPEELDSIWSSSILVGMKINPLSDKIAKDANDDVKKMTLFNKKKTVLHECYPDYYRATYPEHYDPMDVIHARGETLKDLRTAGRPDLDKITGEVFGTDDGKRRKGGDGGAIVDKIVYESLSAYLKGAYDCYYMPDQLKLLSEAKALKINKLGIAKIIEARMLYPSILDFYFDNSMAAAQTMFFDDYRELRRETQEPDLIGEMLDSYELA